MRAVLAASLICLALVLLLNESRALLPRPPAARALADEALAIVAGAKGPLLPAAVPAGGGERVGEVLRIGDRTLVGDGGSGVRAAFLGPAFELRAERRFDVAGSPEALRELERALDGVAPGGLVVLASSGRLEPLAPDASAPALGDVVARVGASARPGAATPESWALIAARLEGGWVPLAEAYSRDTGVALAFVVAPDLERYRGFRGDLALVRGPARSEVYLEEELANASARTPGASVARGRAVAGRPLDGLAVPPVPAEGGAATPGRVAWSGVTAGAGSGLVAWVGLADGSSEGSDGVVFRVRVDGETVAEQRALPGAPWRVLQVDLRRFAGRAFELELSADPLGNARGDAALFGRPVLVHGYDRSPLEALR